MVRIPQGRRGRRFWAVVCLAGILAGCNAKTSASSQTQRLVSEAQVQSDLFVSVTYGAIRGFTNNALVARSASPLVQMLFDPGPNATGPVSVELRNIHRDASLRVSTATFLDSGEVSGCPIVTGLQVDCVAAANAIGNACQSSAQCPDGLRCASGACAPTDLYSACTAPDTHWIPGQPNSLKFDLEITPCVRKRLETALPPDIDPTLRFGVLGPTRDVGVISGLADTFKAANLDFVVLLGDNVGESSTAGLDELERAMARLGTPAVVMAGAREVLPSNGDDFLRRFGPHDHVFDLKGVGFFAFYSVDGQLGPRGLARLGGFLNEQAGSSPKPADPPLIGFTHVPPFDPNGLRGAGFRNDLQAAQVMSILERYGVDELFAGGLATGRKTMQDVDVVVTTGHGTTLDKTREWVYVEVLPTADPSKGRVVGDRTIVVQRRAIP